MPGLEWTPDQRSQIQNKLRSPSIYSRYRRFLKLNLWVTDSHQKLVINNFKKIQEQLSLRAGSLVWRICVRQSWRQKSPSVSKRNGARKSEPAQKPLNFEFRPCEVTSPNCQGIHYLTNTREAKCKQSRHCKKPIDLYWSKQLSISSS